MVKLSGLNNFLKKKSFNLTKQVFESKNLMVSFLLLLVLYYYHSNQIQFNSFKNEKVIFNFNENLSQNKTSKLLNSPVDFKYAFYVPFLNPIQINNSSNKKLSILNKKFPYILPSHSFKNLSKQLILVDVYSNKNSSKQDYYEVDEDKILRKESIGENKFTNLNTKIIKEDHVNLDHTIEVISSKTKVELKIDNKTIFNNENQTDRGFHLFVLNQNNLKLMSHRVFDTYSSSLESDLLNEFILFKISKNRLLIFAIKDEATYSLNNKTISLLQKFGCKLCSKLGWRDMYILITLNSQNSNLLLEERLSKNLNFKNWAKPINLILNINLKTFNNYKSCQPPYDYLDETKNSKMRRIFFCNNVEGYYDTICNCKYPTKIEFKTKNILGNFTKDVPVAIIAANRPYYLYNMLNSLLIANGVNKTMITIYIDGFFKEPLMLGKLFDLRVIQHEPIGKGNSRISQHYFFSLNDLFNRFFDKNHAVIFEEDLIVSPDILNYFSQTLFLLENDPSLYCISAWNDQGYIHSSNDEKLLYRVETMPGLGWMLSKNLWINDLKPNWPSFYLNWDWDLWMRQPNIRKNRECVIPDVSRTYHLGINGVNMNIDFHQRYFEFRAFNKLDLVNLTDVDKLFELNYELTILDLIKKSKTLNEELNFSFASNLIEEEKDYQLITCDNLLKFSKYLIQNKNYSNVNTVYFSMQNEDDFDTWLNIATCFELWDLDPRGFHKSMWRFFFENIHFLFIGYPSSPYSILKKPNVKPLKLIE